MLSCVYSKGTLITGSADGSIYNWPGEVCVAPIKAHAKKVHSLVVYNDFLYSGGDDGKILAWRTEKNGQVKVCEAFYDTRSAYQ